MSLVSWLGDASTTLAMTTTNVARAEAALAESIELEVDACAAFDECASAQNLAATIETKLIIESRTRLLAKAKADEALARKALESLETVSRSEIYSKACKRITDLPFALKSSVEKLIAADRLAGEASAEIVASVRLAQEAHIEAAAFASALGLHNDFATLAKPSIKASRLHANIAISMARNKENRPSPAGYLLGVEGPAWDAITKPATPVRRLADDRGGWSEEPAKPATIGRYEYDAAQKIVEAVHHAAPAEK